LRIAELFSNPKQALVNFRIFTAKSVDLGETVKIYK
jgi:hypothetical protein